MFDLKITGGTVVDGTGADRFTADVAIKDGKMIGRGAHDMKSGVAAMVCLALLAFCVVNNRPIEQQVFLTAAAGLFLGLDIYDRLKGKPS